MNIIPTLLTTNIEEFKAQLTLFQKPFPRIQLDIADGILVPNKTTQIEEMIDVIQNNEVKIEPETSFDFHLMIKDYATELQKIEKFRNLGLNVNVALINFRLNPHIDELSAQYPHLAIGLDLNPDVEISSVTSHYNPEMIKAIQVMSVNPGFQGSPFLPQVLEKIQQLRNTNYRSSIFMDGGINGETIPVIMAKEFRPDFLCIGSYLTKAGDRLNERIEYLKSL